MLSALQKSQLDNSIHNQSVFFSRIHDESDTFKLSKELKELVQGKGYDKFSSKKEEDKLFQGVYKAFEKTEFEAFAQSDLKPIQDPVRPRDKKQTLDERDPNLGIYEIIPQTDPSLLGQKVVGNQSRKSAARIEASQNTGFVDGLTPAAVAGGRATYDANIINLIGGMARTMPNVNVPYITYSKDPEAGRLAGVFPRYANDYNPSANSNYGSRVNSQPTVYHPNSAASVNAFNANGLTQDNPNYAHQKSMFTDHLRQEPSSNYEWSEEMKTYVRRNIPALANTNVKKDDIDYFQRYSGDLDLKNAQGRSNELRRSIAIDQNKIVSPSQFNLAESVNSHYRVQGMQVQQELQAQQNQQAITNQILPQGVATRAIAPSNNYQLNYMNTANLLNTVGNVPAPDRSAYYQTVPYYRPA